MNAEGFLQLSPDDLIQLSSWNGTLNLDGTIPFSSSSSSSSSSSADQQPQTAHPPVSRVRTLFICDHGKQLTRLPPVVGRHLIPVLVKANEGGSGGGVEGGSEGQGGGLEEKGVKEFILYNNGLQVLPKELVLLKDHLVKLNVHDNKLQHIDFGLPHDAKDDQTPASSDSGTFIGFSIF